MVRIIIIVSCPAKQLVVQNYSTSILSEVHNQGHVQFHTTQQLAIHRVRLAPLSMCEDMPSPLPISIPLLYRG